jgi:hypothetical protein
MMPKMAFMLAQVLCIAALVAAVLATAVAALVFPEYSSDLVWQGHHEGLEHLLHMAHHVLGSKVGACVGWGGFGGARGSPVAGLACADGARAPPCPRPSPSTKPAPQPP